MARVALRGYRERRLTPTPAVRFAQTAVIPDGMTNGQNDPEQTLPSSRGRREAATANFSVFPADDLKETDMREGQGFAPAKDSGFVVG
jgi:hypothetical protein